MFGTIENNKVNIRITAKDITKWIKSKKRRKKIFHLRKISKDKYN